MISADKKEEEKVKEDEVNKTEENNTNKIDDINDLIFPIFKIQKQEESKILEYDSLSILNKNLSLSPIDLYSMNLKFPDSIESISPRDYFQRKILSLILSKILIAIFSQVIQNIIIFLVVKIPNISIYSNLFL